MTDAPWIGFIRYRLRPRGVWASGRIEYRSPTDYGIEFHRVFVASADDERAFSALTAAILASAAGDRARAREIADADGVGYGIAWGSRPGEVPTFLRRRGPFRRQTRQEVMR